MSSRTGRTSSSNAPGLGERELGGSTDGHAGSPSAPFQLLQTVTGWDPEVVQVLGGVEKQQLPMGRPLQLRTEQLDSLPLPDPFRFFVGEGSEHLSEHNVQRY